MGWLLGLFGNFSETELRKCKRIHSSPLYQIKTNHLYLVSGGLPEACIFSPSSDYLSEQKEGWVISGVGIQTKNNDRASFMKKQEWDTELSKTVFDPSVLNGHFVAAKWNANEIRFYTDQLGLKNLYMAQEDGYVVFSTRLDWVAQYKNSSKLNLAEIGSRWLMINQLSHDSMLQNVERLGQCGEAVFTLNSSSITNRPWHPSMAAPLQGNIYHALQEFTTFGLREENNFR